MVIECGDPAVCQAVAQRMRELMMLGIWAVMGVVIVAGGAVQLWEWLYSDTSDTEP